MKSNKFLSVLAALLLSVSILNLSVPARALFQIRPSVQESDSELAKRVARIEEQFENRRKELGIPGMSVAIVKDGKVLLSKGYGYKDFEKKIPMTPDTQLAIGSASKAFTALSVLMLQDEGKLSLNDQPRKHIPYFRINNPDTNEKIQVRDLLSHSSGLNRTDLAMLTGKLNREELIRVAGIAKPMAGLREKFYYQNLMFAAAGEIVSKVSGTPWEEFVPGRIFAPLGMNNSTMSVKEMQKAPDYSFGYVYNFDLKKTRQMPTRDLGPVAPAGSINSSSNDMSKWLQFTLNGGKVGDRALISPESFEEWTKPQMKISPDGKVSYGLGWFVQEWKGKSVLQHGGNIDGFNSMVAMLPDENLGFVVLTNVSASSLGSEMMQMVWSGILEDTKETPAGSDQEKEVGKYIIPGTQAEFNILIEDGKLVAKVTGQPTYILEKVEGRKYSLSNAPPGFFITFKDAEAYIEQPQGNFTLEKVGAPKTKEPAADESVKGFVGAYAFPEAGFDISVLIEDGKLVAKVPDQPTYILIREEGSKYALSNAPPGFFITFRENEAFLEQPQGNFTLKKRSAGGDTDKSTIKALDLIAKVRTALGGEENMRKITTRKAVFDLDAVHQGVKGSGTSYSKAPGMIYSNTTLTALGKKIGWIREYFDGSNGGERYSFAEEDIYSGKRLEDVRFSQAFFPFLDLEKKLEKSEVLSSTEFEGQQVYVLALYPKDASRVVYLISADTFLPVKYSSVIVSSTSSQQIPVTAVYSDYRKKDGLMIPFKTVANNAGMGDIVTTIRKIKHNVRIKDDLFKMP